MLQVTEAQYRNASTILGVETSILKAIVEVESRGGGFVGQNQPKILFEAHKFRKHTKAIYDREYPSISKRYPQSRKHYSKGRNSTVRGLKELSRLDRACSLNPEAACKSASYGFPQIMGSNFKACGFNSAVHMREQMSLGIKQQLLAFVMFLKHNRRIVSAMKSKDFRTIARLYNGKSYAKYGYHTKIEKAYTRYKNKSNQPIQKPRNNSVSLNTLKAGGATVLGIGTTDILPKIQESTDTFAMVKDLFMDTGNIALFIAIGIIIFLLVRRNKEYKTGML